MIDWGDGAIRIVVVWGVRECVKCVLGGESRSPYKNTFFSPFGGLKRLGARGRRGSGEGLRGRAGLGRMRGTAATLGTLDFMIALGAFMVDNIFRSKDVEVFWESAHSAKTICSEICEVVGADVTNGRSTVGCLPSFTISD